MPDSGPRGASQRARCDRHRRGNGTCRAGGGRAHRGPAGMGKTTLLRHGLGALGPEVRICRSRLTSWPTRCRWHCCAPRRCRRRRRAVQRRAGVARSLADSQRTAVDGRRQGPPLGRSAVAPGAGGGRPPARARADRAHHHRPPEHHGVDDGWQRLRADPDRCRRVSLDQLSWQDVSALATARGMRLGDAAAQRLHEHTGGNALYVSTLLGELSESELNVVGGNLPAPRTLALTTVGRLAELPAAAFDLAATLAVLNRPTPLAVLATVAASVIRPHRWTPCCRPGSSSGGGRIRRDRSCSPTRCSAPRCTTTSRRRAGGANAAAAASSDHATTLIHRVAAADRADNELAAELEAAAPIGTGSAWRCPRAMWRWAAVRHGRRWSAACSRRRGLPLRQDQPSAVRGAREELETCRPSPLRDLVLGQLAWLDGDQAASGGCRRRRHVGRIDRRRGAGAVGRVPQRQWSRLGPR